ncbi:MAG: KH domain-containing protein [Candidatus Micrarchaeales archaeon]
MKTILPGEQISDKPVRMENGVIEDGKTYATVIGLLDEASQAFIPLETVWYPRRDDFVIGIVENSRNSVYNVNLSSPFRGLIIGRRGETSMNIGDVVSASIRDVQRESDQIINILWRERKLFGGKLIMVRPSKVPRIIGKQNTMIKQLEAGTKSTILTGMNGMVWIKGGDIPLAIKAIKKIQDEAHVSGLTERIAKMLNEESK